MNTCTYRPGKYNYLLIMCVCTETSLNQSKRVISRFCTSLHLTLKNQSDMVSSCLDSFFDSLEHRDRHDTTSPIYLMWMTLYLYSLHSLRILYRISMDIGAVDEVNKPIHTSRRFHFCKQFQHLVSKALTANLMPCR